MNEFIHALAANFNGTPGQSFMVKTPQGLFLIKSFSGAYTPKRRVRPLIYLMSA